MTRRKDPASGKTAVNAAPGPNAMVESVMSGYLGFWLGYLVSAFLMSFVCHGVFHIPLWQVFDVNVSFFIAVVAYQIVVLAVGLGVDLSEGDVLTAVMRTMYMGLWLLVPFASIMGFSAYAWFNGEELKGASFVYDGITEYLVHFYSALAASTGDFLGIMVTRGHTITVITRVDGEALMRWMLIFSAAVAVLEHVLGRMSRAPSTAG